MGIRVDGEMGGWVGGICLLRSGWMEFVGFRSL